MYNCTYYSFIKNQYEGSYYGSKFSKLYQAHQLQTENKCQEWADIISGKHYSKKKNVLTLTKDSEGVENSD